MSDAERRRVERDRAEARIRAEVDREFPGHTTTEKKVIAGRRFMQWVERHAIQIK